MWRWNLSSATHRGADRKRKRRSTVSGSLPLAVHQNRESTIFRPKNQTEPTIATKAPCSTNTWHNRPTWPGTKATSRWTPSRTLRWMWSNSRLKWSKEFTSPTSSPIVQSYISRSSLIIVCQFCRSSRVLPEARIGDLQSFTLRSTPEMRGSNWTIIRARRSTDNSVTCNPSGHKMRTPSRRRPFPLANFPPRNQGPICTNIAMSTILCIRN